MSVITTDINVMRRIGNGGKNLTESPQIHEVAGSVSPVIEKTTAVQSRM